MILIYMGENTINTKKGIRLYVNTIMHVWVPKNDEDFMDSYAILAAGVSVCCI
jgi:hypothetical protein